MGRITAFVRWVARTPWPVFTLGMLQADIIGALFVLGFLRFGLPAEDRIQLQDLPALNLAIFLGYLFVSFTILSWLTLRLLIPSLTVTRVSLAIALVLIVVVTIRRAGPGAVGRWRRALTRSRPDPAPVSARSAER